MRVNHHVDGLSVSQGAGKVGGFDAVAGLVEFTVEFVFVFDQRIVASDLCDIDDAARDLLSVREGGRDGALAAQEKEQSDRRAQRREADHKDGRIFFDERVNEVDDPRPEDRYEQVLGEVVGGDNLKKGRGVILHE